MKLGGEAMRALVERKRRGAEHTRDEIDSLIKAYNSGAIGDDDVASWLRAVVACGLGDEETAWLTQAMASSGVMLSWSDVAGVVVDKHSTGGVGDAVSLIAVPLAAACGVKVAKLAGRALWHTGGTIDKLECVPNLHTDLAVTTFKRQVAEVGCAIAQASDEIAPADKKMYALRHRTQTVANVGLITASVLSKKIAGGAPYLVIDVKCGRCAFMKTPQQARELARMIAQVGRRLGRSVTVLITDMDAPLARSIGDALELDEALGVLQGREGGRLGQVALAVAEAMLAVQQDDDRSGAAARMTALQQALHDGTAYRRFSAMASAQGGDLSSFQRQVEPALTIAAEHSGFIGAIDGRAIGAAVAGSKSEIGAQGAWIGIRLRKSEGDPVAKGEALADVFADVAAAKLAQIARDAVQITSQAPLPRAVVIERTHAGASS
ncbi:MAG TPA: thymidine phosphorylase [Candidatus Eremiobacteraceae bacterium]|nr:thymidine phosphorylase [Candidatus Eremiobacteraceae bacterium]